MENCRNFRPASEQGRVLAAHEKQRFSMFYFPWSLLMIFNFRNPKVLEESPEAVGNSGQGTFTLSGRESE